MIFKKTVTKRDKRNASKKRLVLLLIFLGLVVLNIVLIYKSFFEQPKPIINPLARNQTSSTEEIEKKLDDGKVQYSSISTQKDLKYLIKLKNGAEVIIDPNKDIDEQLASLQLILSQIKIEGKTLKRLDFGFKKPIITF